MAKIDDLQNSFNALESAVRDFLNSGSGVAGALQQELDALKADDDVENSKLDGMQAQVDSLRSSVESARTSASDAGAEVPQETAGEPLPPEESV